MSEPIPTRPKCEHGTKIGNHCYACEGEISFAAPPGSAPWFVLLYLGALALLLEIDWRLGVAWLLWRSGHAAADEWVKQKPNDQAQRRG